MFLQVSFALLAVAMCFVSAYAAEQPAKQSSQSAAPTGDRNKRGLYASPYLAAPYAASPYVASPYVASPYVASPYAASPYVASPYVASPYAAAPYVASHHPYGAVSSYATYPYVAKTFASPYAYYPWEKTMLHRCGAGSAVTPAPSIPIPDSYHIVTKRLLQLHVQQRSFYTLNSTLSMIFHLWSIKNS